MMDIFLMVEKSAKEVERYNYWVGNNVLYGHLLIFIQLENEYFIRLIQKMEIL